MKSRQEWKVGLFVLIGLVLLGALLLQFSKGTTWLRSTYTIRLKAMDVAGLKLRAGVLMSGVQIGSLADIQLAEDGKSVILLLRIYSRYQVHKDARFSIQQSGFLGDQYISIQPTDNKEPLFQDGDQALAETPFSLTEIARTAGGLAERLDVTAKNLNDAMVDLRRLLLNEETLTNLSATAANARRLSERGVVTVDNLNGVIETNRLAVSLALSNLVGFTESIRDTAGDLNGVVATNAAELRLAMENLQVSTGKLKGLMEEAEAGRGLAGALFKDEKIASDLSQISGNLSVTTSNLNRLGLWGILWRRREASEPAPRVSEPVRSPRDSGSRN